MPRRVRARRNRLAWLLALVVAAAAAAIPLLPGSGSDSGSGSGSSGAPPVAVTPAPEDTAARPGAPDRPLGPADGAVPDGTTVWDDGVPGVANLDPALLTALRDAASAASADGIGLEVDSGWRSPEYQEGLLREAVAKYGSEAEAARWVATPETSAHVSGDAVDVGPREAAGWLSENGAAYGLCQTYGNEPWHYELRPHARDLGCPPMYADPTHDPRMRG